MIIYIYKILFSISFIYFSDFSINNKVCLNRKSGNTFYGGFKLHF